MSTGNSPFAGYQLEIYQAGLEGSVPQIPISFSELEQKARSQLSPGAFDYVAGAAGAEDTMRANLEAFQRWRILPRMLRDVSSRDLRTEIFGTAMPAPVLLAPVGVLSIIHPQAELAVARAAAQLGLTMVLSTLSSFSLEEVAQANGNSPRWFQLYWPKDRAFTVSILNRAERAGYGAIVVTLDSKLLGWRPRDLSRSYLPFLRGEGLANYFSDPIFRSNLAKPPAQDVANAVGYWTQMFSDPRLTWEDLAFLRSNTRLPLLLKGILAAHDAKRAADLGIDGLIVSNHGGRQVDGAVAALDCLPRVVRAAGTMPVLFDSGIRTGADAFKALALGAKAVLVGRPYVYGLALAADIGVATVLRYFLADLDLTLALAGLTGIHELSEAVLERSLL